jgi:hypothetical protein
MTRLDYFKGMIAVLIIMPLLGVLSIFTADGASDAWRIIIPASFFSITIGVVLYGFIKYK